MSNSNANRGAYIVSTLMHMVQQENSQHQRRPEIERDITRGIDYATEWIMRLQDEIVLMRAPQAFSAIEASQLGMPGAEKKS